ncbi:hypothetical protein ACO0QE_000448 [Hanseniaspora vineae]
MIQRNYGLEIFFLSFDDIDTKAEPGDIVHVETPTNPFGTCYDLQKFADKAHAKKALLLVDSTFAPPPLQKV